MQQHNEGNIEILSAITDATTQRGTTNIGTATTSATVVANSITQKVLNINNGSSLAINADNLKIADTINNSGTITLAGGELTSAIGGENGTTVIDGDVIANAAIANAITVNTDKELTIAANNIQGAVTNAGTINIGEGTLAQNITGTGSTSISGNVVNNATIRQNVSITENGTLSSNLAAITGSVTNEGTFNLGDNLSKDIAGDGTTFLGSDITLSADRTVSGTLNMNDKTIDMSNTPADYNTLTVGSLTGNGNLQIDVDLTANNDKATNSDKINITSGTTNSGTLNLDVINVENELATNDSPYQDYVDYVTGTTDGLTFNINGSADGQIVAVTTDHKYTFTKGNDGSLDVLAQDYTGGLSDYITGEITANNFSINKNTTLNDNENIGLTQGADTTKNVFINKKSPIFFY